MSSVTSDVLDIEDAVFLTEESMDYEFNEAPYDILSDHNLIGTIVVVKKGAQLPLTTSWKVSEGVPVAVKFSVSKSLKVTVADERPRKLKVNQVTSVSPGENNNGAKKFRLEESPSLNLTSTPSSTGEKDLRPTKIDFGPSGDLRAEEEEGFEVISEINFDKSSETVGGIGASSSSSRARKFRSYDEFLTHVEANFDEIVIGGLESRLRGPVSEKLGSDSVLLPTENRNIVHSLNQAFFDQYGATKPVPKVCQKMAEILKRKFPATFRVKQVVQTEFGTFDIPKARGEGGSGDLCKRLGDNFHNRFLRQGVTRPSVGNDKSIKALGLAVSKKKSKTYALNGDKWRLGSEASKEEKEFALQHYMKLEDEGSLEGKLKLIKEARPFIQGKFEQSQPSQAVEDLQEFWKGGPKILSSWFQWISDGSEEDSLAAIVSRQTVKVMNLVEQFLMSKKEADYERELATVKETTDRHFGNDIFYKIYLIQELAKVFKNEKEKVIFIDNRDDKKCGPGEQEPNIFVIKKDSLGQVEYDKIVILSLRIGEKIVFKDISFAEAVAGLIELYHVFNLQYPAKSDDTYQFLQRIFCSFGPSEGARNQRNVVKKWYKQFAVGLEFVFIQQFRLFFQGFVAEITLRADEGEIKAVNI